MKSLFFRKQFSVLGVFIVAGIFYTLFAWKVDSSSFLLNLSFYQTHAFLTGLPLPQAGLIWEGYNPLKDIPAFLLADLFNHHLLWLRISLGCLVGIVLWGSYKAYASLFLPQQKNFACLLTTVLLATLPLFYEQLGTLSNLWIPFLFFLGGTALLLRKNTVLSLVIGGGLLGAASGLNMPFSIPVLGMLFFVLTEKNFKKSCFFILGCALGFILTLLPWVIALFQKGYSLSLMDLIKTVPIYSFTSNVNNKVCNFLGLVVPLLGVWVFRPKSKNHSLLLYRYSFAVSMMWIIACELSLFKTRMFTIFSLLDLFFILQAASLPIIAALTTQLKNKNFSFIGGFIVGVFCCFIPLTYHRLEVDSFMDVRFPFHTTSNDIVFLKARNHSYLMAFLPEETSFVNLKGIPDYTPSQHNGNFYLVTPFHPVREDLEGTLLSRYSAEEITLPKLKLKKGIFAAKECRPILTNRSSLDGFSPMMCLLENPVDKK